MMGRNSWAENSVQLDLLERALTFCPGDNMTAIEKAGIPWDSLEFQLLDRCVEAGCDGKFDLCCPYSEPRTYGLIKVTKTADDKQAQWTTINKVEKSVKL